MRMKTPTHKPKKKPDAKTKLAAWTVRQKYKSLFANEEEEEKKICNNTEKYRELLVSLCVPIWFILLFSNI